MSHSWVEGYRRAVDENPNSLRKYIEKLRSNPITGPSTAITNSERQRSAAMKVTKKVEFADNEYFAPSNNRPPKWHVFRSPRNPSFTVPPTRCSQNVFFCFKRAKNGFGKISIDGRFRQSGASRNHQSATRQLHDRQQLAKSYDNLRVSIARWSRSSLLILSHWETANLPFSTAFLREALRLYACASLRRKSDRPLGRFGLKSPSSAFPEHVHSGDK